MKRLALLLWLVLMLTPLRSMRAQQPESYPMICHGGGKMTLAILPGLHTDSGDFICSYYFEFAKSPYAGSQRQPAPGECAWLDRPIGGDEPSVLIWMKPQLKGPNSDNVCTVITANKVDVATTAKEVNELIDAVKNGKIFYVYCRRDGERFLITKIGL